MLVGLFALTNVRASSAGGLDCDKVDVRGFGSFGNLSMLNATDEDGTMLFVFHPPLAKDQAPYPVMVYSHGATGEWAMYEDAFRRFVSHGFVVIFPHIKGPKQDTKSLTTDPMGGFTMKGFNYAKSANEDEASPLHGFLDLSNVVLAGHSMGATSTIMAAHKLPAGSVKLAYAQHPGLCGPYGPPPCFGHGALCNTWMPADFEDVSSKVPVILSTATNDGAFWPAPGTANHEFGCFNKSTKNSDFKVETAFVQFSEEACEDDGQGGRYDRHWSNGGHDCPMKSGSVEMPWVIVAAKLYAQLGGDKASKCHAMLWGTDSDSLSQDPAVEAVVTNSPIASFLA